jgi:two-component system, response regulator PdtaR
MVSPQLRVLVVENHQLMAVGLNLLLDQLGHTVVETVGTGEEAIVAAERHRPDFICMDIVLDGEMDGIEAAQEIQNRFGVRSLFFTGLSDPETRERAALAQPIAFMDKTIPETQLARAISAFAAEVKPPIRQTREEPVERSSS